VVAQAAGDPNKAVIAQQLLGGLNPADQETRNGIITLQNLYTLNKAESPNTSTPLLDTFNKAVRNQIDAPENADVLSKALHLGDPRIISAFDSISFVDEPDKYLGPTKIQIAPVANHQLPDPRSGWATTVEIPRSYEITGNHEISEWAAHAKLVVFSYPSLRRNILIAHFNREICTVITLRPSVNGSIHRSGLGRRPWYFSLIGKFVPSRRGI
jgi:hypothetical protein